MDVYCHRCGEPWEIDTFWDVAEENGLSYNDVQQLFKKTGCEVMTGGYKCEVRRDHKGELMTALYDVLGDDFDGIAATLEDFDFMD